MSAKREFNLFTAINSTNDCDAEDILQFSRFESARDDQDSGGGEIGLSISFTIDEASHDEDNFTYEMYRIGPNNRKKKKVDTINIAYCIDNTDEIRDLADWLMEQADEIDKEKKRK